MRPGATVWLTGLSGAGKSTVCALVCEELERRGRRVEWLDGDALRRVLTADLGFSERDRMINIQRTVYVCRLLNRHGVIVLASLITPYRHMRDYCREQLDVYYEVYVKCELAVCIKRDVKGLYAKALAGEIPAFTGVSDRFEEPVRPELVLETQRETVRQSADKVLELLAQNGYLD